MDSMTAVSSRRRSHSLVSKPVPLPRLNTLVTGDVGFSVESRPVPSERPSVSELLVESLLTALMQQVSKPKASET